ncbi:sigma 54-interacting transcriptional regulator [Lachnospiraceae bacterium 62-35]
MNRNVWLGTGRFIEGVAEKQAIHENLSVWQNLLAGYVLLQLCSALLTVTGLHVNAAGFLEGGRDMVKILVFIPHLDMKERFEKVVSRLDLSDNMDIELVHVFGTPQSLADNREADIIVARGMTYDYLHTVFPDKHMIRIQLTSFDIFDALVRARDDFHPKRMALCIHNQEIHAHSLKSLEELCRADIDLYDVWDEDSSKKAIEKGLKRGTEVFIGAGTICGLCDEKGVARVHIETKNAAIDAAIRSAVSVARTMNIERMKSSILYTILNKNEDAIIAVNEEGKVLAVNNQTYRTFQVSTTERVVGYPMERISPRLNWRQAALKGSSNTSELMEIRGKKYYVEYHPIIDDSTGAGTLIVTKSAEQIQETEIKLRQSLSEKGLTAKYTFDDIIGASQAIHDNIRMARRYSRVDSNVLIIGETGTGKELFAHSIHQESSRRDEPFVALNCAALPENLLESELFGYEPGAFSGASKNGKIGLFELAHRGTIFLDEIGEVPIALQAKLLRVLQEREIRRIGSDRVTPVNVRVISATNINIEKQIEEGNFRSDLYYRLNLLDIVIPPLRERKEDVQDLVDYYLTRFACDMGRRIPRVSKEAARMLREYDWPGNVRELRNICERLIVLTETEEIREEDLFCLKIFKDYQRRGKQKSEKKESYDDIYEQLQPRRKKQDIAKELGVSRTTLWRMAKRQEKLNRSENRGVE